MPCVKLLISAKYSQRNLVHYRLLIPYLQLINIISRFQWMLHVFKYWLQRSKKICQKSCWKFRNKNIYITDKLKENLQLKEVYYIPQTCQFVNEMFLIIIIFVIIHQPHLLLILLFLSSFTFSHHHQWSA